MPFPLIPLLIGAGAGLVGGAAKTIGEAGKSADERKAEADKARLSWITGQHGDGSKISKPNIWGNLIGGTAGGALTGYTIGQGLEGVAGGGGSWGLMSDQMKGANPFGVASAGELASAAGLPTDSIPTFFNPAQLTKPSLWPRG